MSLVCALEEDIRCDAVERYISHEVLPIFDGCSANVVVAEAEVPHVGNERIMMIDVNELVDFFVCVAESDDKL